MKTIKNKAKNSIKSLSEQNYEDHLNKLSINTDRTLKETNSNVPDKCDDIKNINSMSSEFFHSQLIEKDKLIFEYSKILKELENKNNNITRELNNIHENNIYLKDQINEINFKFNASEKNNSKKEDYIKSLKQSYEDKLNIMKKENEFINEQLTTTTKSKEALNIKVQSLLLEIRKLEKNTIKLKEIESNKSLTIVNLEKTIKSLRNETNQQLFLKRQSKDLEDAIVNYKQEIDKLNKINTKLETEKEELNTYINNLLTDNRFSKELNNKIQELNNIKIKLQDDNEELKCENFELLNKINNSVKDNKIFFKLISEDLINIQNEYELDNSELLESDNIGCMNNTNIKSIDNRCLKKNYTIEGVTINNLSNTLRNKYNIIKKQLKCIVEIYNTCNYDKDSKLSRANNNLKNTEEKYNKLLEDFNQHKKQYNILELKFNNINDININLKKQLTDANSNILNSNENIEKLNIKIKELDANINNTENEYSILLNKLCSKLDINYESDKIENEILKDKTKLYIYKYPNNSILNQIINKITTITELNAKLSISLIEQKDINNNSNSKLKELNKEIDNLKESTKKELANKDLQIENSNKENIKDVEKAKEILYEKVKALNNIIEESNIIIKSLELENKDLKRNINKQERHINVLTGSHIELEKSIENNHTTLKIKIEDLEKQVSLMNRETELKNIHISSLESLVNKKKEEINLLVMNQNKLYNKSNFGKVVIDSNYLKHNNVNNCDNYYNDTKSDSNLFDRINNLDIKVDNISKITNKKGYIVKKDNSKKTNNNFNLKNIINEEFVYQPNKSVEFNNNYDNLANNINDVNNSSNNKKNKDENNDNDIFYEIKKPDEIKNYNNYDSNKNVNYNEDYNNYIASNAN